jgi:integrase
MARPACYRSGRQRAQAEALIRELPTHQRDVVLFALTTGLRQSNVVGLEWSHINLDAGHAWIGANQSHPGIAWRQHRHTSCSDWVVGARRGWSNAMRILRPTISRALRAGWIRCSAVTIWLRQMSRHRKRIG